MSPLFPNSLDIRFVAVCIVVWLVVVGSFFRKRFAAVSTRSEQICSATALAFLSLAVVIPIIDGVGLINLWLKFSTGTFWIFWELFLSESIIGIFWIFPFVAIGLIFWALIGRWKMGFSSHCVKLASVSLLAVLIDVAFYFLMSYTIVKIS